MNAFATRRAALKTLALGAAAVLAACASAPDLRHDQDPTVNLRAYRTFAFYDTPADASGYAALIGKHLQQATREQLEHQHYVYSERDPDLRVAMFLRVAEHPELRTSGSARGGYRGWSGGIETVNVRQGSLRIDLVDTKKNALVWQGVAEGRIDSSALRSPSLTVRAAVAEIFAHYGQAQR